MGQSFGDGLTRGIDRAATHAVNELGRAVPSVELR
jgi:hypothetical protein